MEAICSTGNWGQLVRHFRGRKYTHELCAELVNAAVLLLDYGHEDTYNKLLKWRGYLRHNEELLHNIYNRGYIDILENLLQYHKRFGSRYDILYRMLRHAAEHGKSRIVELLLRNSMIYDSTVVNNIIIHCDLQALVALKSRHKFSNSNNMAAALEVDINKAKFLMECGVAIPILYHSVNDLCLGSINYLMSIEHINIKWLSWRKKRTIMCWKRWRRFTVGKWARRLLQVWYRPDMPGGKQSKRNIAKI